MATMGMGEDKNVGDGPTFVVTSVDNRGNHTLNNLDSADAVLMASGLTALGMRGEMDLRVQVTDLFNLLGSPKEILYHTGHGTFADTDSGVDHAVMLNEGAITPEGMCFPENCVPTNPLIIGVRYVFFASCSVGNAYWPQAFSERTEAVFSYTGTVLDISDSRVVVQMLRCIEQSKMDGDPLDTDEYLACWQISNEAAGGNYAATWNAYVRTPDGIVEYP